MDVELATGLAKDLAQARIEIKTFSSVIELLLRNMPSIDGRRGSLGGHLDRNPPGA
jgi:hypothetical protein